MAFAPIAAAAAIGGAAISAYGSIRAGQATKAANNYKAAVAENNRIAAERQGEYALQSGAAQAHTQALKGRAIGGRIKAGQAASGVDVNSGSAVDVQEAQREQSQLDVETVLNNADLANYGYKVKGENFRSEAGLLRAAGDEAETAGYLKGAGTMLSAVGSLGGKWTGGADADGVLAGGKPLGQGGIGSA